MIEQTKKRLKAQAYHPSIPLVEIKRVLFFPSSGEYSSLFFLLLLLLKSSNFGLLEPAFIPYTPSVRASTHQPFPVRLVLPWS